MTLDWNQLKTEARTRRSGFLAALLRHGRRDGAVLDIDPESRARVEAEFPVITEPAPGETTSHRRELRGLGDVVERVAVATGIKAAVKAVEHLTGVPCGCDGRRDWLNKVVPFGEPKHE
jgi:hypothetical protein